jgi:transposase
MEKLDKLVADHIEKRLLQPKRLEQILLQVLGRRQERAPNVGQRISPICASVRLRRTPNSSAYTTPSRTAVHTRFSRWAKSGIWEKLFKHLATAADNEYAMIDANIVRAHQHSAGARKKTAHKRSGAAKAG